MPATKLALKAPKKLKIPKSIGACADLLYDITQERLAAEKIVDAMKANETMLKTHIIDNLPKGDRGAAGKHHQVTTRVESVSQVDAENGGWEAVYKYIKKNDAWDLLQRRLSDKAIKDRLEDMRGKPIPGIKLFPVVKISLTQVK